MRSGLFFLEKPCHFISNRQKILCLVLIFMVTIFAFPVFAAGSFSYLGKPFVDIVNDLILWILSIIGKICLFIIILGGVFYAVSGSKVEAQEKAKKIITSAIFGIIFVLLSYAFLKILEKIFV
ncbi:hypothetical protein KAS31_04505 [Candidatus Parcubacteria bacterium]|nr:hypothetical protein [Candidatus Parcubacteria bacterium]